MKGESCSYKCAENICLFRTVAAMTDKELRKLKRSDLLEIMFYLRDELDKLNKENESLKSRIDELSKAALNTGASNTVLSDELKSQITDAVKEAAESYFSKKQEQ